MSTGLYSGVSGLALGTGLYRNVSGLWSGASGLIAGFDGLALYLNFLTTTTLDSRITFTRGSNATLVDSTGKITYAPANLLTYSEQFDNAAWTKSNSSVTANAVAAPDGATTADKLVENTSNSQHAVVVTSGSRPTIAAGLFTQSIYVKAAERSSISLYNNGTSGGAGVVFNLANGTIGTSGGTQYSSSSITSIGNGWYRCSLTFVSLGGTSALTVYLGTEFSGEIYTGDGYSGIYIWGAQLEPVTYQTTPGAYQATTSAAYYGPRFDYDPVTLAAKGLLVEEQRTNLLTYSEQFDDAIWIKDGILAFGSGSTANAVVSPDGTQNADLITPNTNNTTHRVYNTSNTLNATTASFSVFVKANGYTNVGIRESSSTGAGAAFNLANGTVIGAYNAGGSTVSNMTITQFANGWYRLSCTIAFASSTVMGLGVHALSPSYAAGGDLFASWTPNGTSGIYLWGAQLEAGAFATSYIPTVASTVTRSADVATMTGTNFSSWYNQTEGTFVVAADSYGEQGGANAYNLASANDGTAANYIRSYVYSTFAGETVRNGAATQADVGGGTWSQNVAFKLAYVYAANDFRGAVNGALTPADTSGTVPTVSQLTLGSNNGQGSYLNGHLRSLTYYATRLPNSTLQSLTS